MILLALQLITAHVLGDFILQPDAWVSHKRKKKLRSPYFYLHLLVHLLALLILLKFDLQYLAGIGIIVLSHFIFDLIKLHLENRLPSRILFILDQLAHLIILAGILSLYTEWQINPGSVYTPKSLAIILSILCLSSVSAIIIRVFLDQWSPFETDDSQSLRKAGLYIGILERFFVFGFVVLGQWQAIGFLLAAKSVFRFGDLSRAKDRKLTEYVLIGTLLSFGLAILIGLLYNTILLNLLSD